MMPLFAMYNVDAKMKDDDIRQMIIQGFKLCTLSGDGPMLSVDGYGDDPRELWEIPEAVNLAKKLVAMGLCSVLTVSTYLDPRHNVGPSAGRPFGAFELWLLAKQELGKDIEGPRLAALLDEFRTFLSNVSNETATAVAEGRISDGQHKVKPRCEDS